MARVSAVLAAVLSITAGTAQDERIDLGGGVTLDVVKIPAGSFEMGSPSGEVGRGPDEEQHLVTIAEEFRLGRTPVTRGQFARFVKETNYRTEAETGASGGFGFDGTALVQKKEFTWRNPGFPQTDDHPVVIVTYDDALAFVRWLERKSGRRAALPTEAQWEYACRAGTTSRFYAGDSDADAEGIAWFKKNAGNGTRPVAEKAANRFGLVDMSGNVYQWCSDLYAAYVPGGGVQGPMDKPRRVLRGGSWLKDAKQVRSAARARNAPGSRNADNGFRVFLGAKTTVAAPAPVKPAPVEAPPEVPEPEPEPVIPAPEPYTPRAASSSSCGMVTVFVGVVVGALVLIVFVALILRRSANRPQTAPPLMRRRGGPRIADDGFWFETSGYDAGDMVTFTYTGPNGPVTEQFLVEPGHEQFVYTGVRPGDVVLGALIADQLNQEDDPTPPPPRPTPPTEEDDRPRRYPPAY
ncbi:MAG: formylglycine-generating enzyme family protein [Planctomycetota bacterium]|nr:MAG: formylglycine-generating enzyme family protein [Planctomycetota bacterium]